MGPRRNMISNFFHQCVLKTYPTYVYLCTLLLSIKCLVDCLIVDRRFFSYSQLSFYFAVGTVFSFFLSLFLARMVVFCSSPLLLGHLYFLHVWSDLPHLLPVSGLAVLKISFVLLKTFDIAIWFLSCTGEKVHYYSAVDPFSPKINLVKIAAQMLLVRSIKISNQIKQCSLVLSNSDLTNRGQILMMVTPYNATISTLDSRTNFF